MKLFKQLTLLVISSIVSMGLTAQSYYSPAFGLNGSALKTSLHNIIKNHSSQGWPLWSYFPSTDTKSTNIVYDIYSDVPSGIPPYTLAYGVNQCGTYSQEGDCFNHEHTWPSTFFNDAYPMRTDLHHVLPTDGFVNNKRSNLPYGETTTSSWISQNNSKIGFSNTYAGYTDKVFEPIDSFKGDLARIYFYMTTRYESEDGGWGNWTMANGAQLTPDAITLLMAWHHADPVSQKEINRNNAIYLIQNNRNPFIDYPVFADCIWGAVDCAGVGISNLEWAQQIQVYPIPTHDILHLNYPSSIKIHEYQVYDILGRTIITSTLEHKTISISSIPNGNYTIVLNTNQGVIRKLFSKE